MNAAVILIFTIVVLFVAYIFYGRWLTEQWGIDPSRTTPAHELQDGVDYVPAPASVLIGHHFSSIAGAGPINGPIQAAVFGWVPVLLWILIGGIFFGGVHDYGALYASIRHKGKSMGEVINDSMGSLAKKLFLVFGYLTLLLVVAAFASIVASTFGNTDASGKALEGVSLSSNETTAVISVLFIVLAIIFGILIYRLNVHVGIATALGVAAIIGIIALGLVWHPISLPYNVWMILLAVYILIASVTPVWILLQPRDYLSSFLLYFMIAVSIIGILGASLAGKANLDIPAFTGFEAHAGNGLFASGTLFPVLFVTIACGAVSGFHSLVASGTTSKQLNNERGAKLIGYGSMLIECVLAVIALCAVGYVWADVSSDSPSMVAPTAVFAGGISQMIGGAVGMQDIATVLYTLLILAVSVFCLTSLDTATRLARYMFQEFWLKSGETVNDVKDKRKILVNPYFATVVTVVLGIGLGLTGYSKIWPLFGAANQLLAAIGLLAVCAWLGKIGRNNKMFYIPMVFMLLVTVCSLCQTIISKINAIMAGNDVVWAMAQAFIALLLVVLAVVLAVISIRAIAGTRRSAR